MIAETMVGRGDEAFEYYAKLAPSYKNIPQELHKTEPYVYSQMIAGKCNSHIFAYEGNTCALELEQEIITDITHNHEW